MRKIDKTEPPPSDQSEVKTYFRRSVDDILAEQEVEPDRGLSNEEARYRLRRYGPNRLRQIHRRSAWAVLFGQFKSFVVLLLLVAAVTAGAFGEIVEAFAIAAALVINAAIGFVTELTAQRSMDALRRLGEMQARVRRGGQLCTIEARSLVPGDIVVLGEGDIVPADLRLISLQNLQLNEAALTGESQPVAKSADPLDVADPPLAERTNMAFKGTAVTRGEGEGVAIGTGQDTEIGRISELVAKAEEEITPLEKRLEALGHRLIFLVLGVGVVVALSGIIAGKNLFLMIETAIVLAIAAVPEGLPIVSTIALGRGIYRMAQHNALVKQLSAVETLGATTVILTDKTGTLTENRMVVRCLALGDREVEIVDDGEAPFTVDGRAIDPTEHSDVVAALRAGSLCTNAQIGDDEEQKSGDPMEVALVRAAELGDMPRERLREEHPERREVSFDPETKMMATYHDAEDGYLVTVKGAPEAVLDATTSVRRGDETDSFGESERESWMEKNGSLAKRGLRVLAIAEKSVESEDAEPYDDLTLLGLVGLYDPPRAAVRDSITACKNAGIRVVMVTGDQGETGINVAREVGIVANGDEMSALDASAIEERDQKRTREAAVFARVSPEHKLKLVQILQEAGEIVGMTGDGVNDAPALKKADIGIAMGRRGTEVAQEASDIVLRDDAFETIVMAIRQGRTIFGNIRKFVIFLLSGNLGQIVAVSLAAIAAAPLPLLPLQILFLNFLLDVFPALALGVGKGSEEVMLRPPRDPQEPVLTRQHWLAVAGFGVTIGVSVLGAFAVAILILKLTPEEAITISFLTYAFARLWHLFNMREVHMGTVDNDVTRNSFAWAAIAFCAGLLLAVLYVTPAAALLSLAPPSAAGWAIALGGSLVPLIVGQIAIAVIGARRSNAALQGHL